jgi:fibro-slime domain-containing protein
VFAGCSGGGGEGDASAGDSGIATAETSSSGATGESDDGGSEGTTGDRLDSLVDDGDGTGATDTGGQDCEMAITATIRDFSSTHPDFEAFWGTSAFTSLVMPTLGADDTPEYNPSAVAPPGYNGSFVQITSAATFSDWYHDVSGTNVPVEVSLDLFDGAPGSGIYTYDNPSFFPVDGAGFNNETFPDTNNGQHNFHFTTEIHLEFVYEPGQEFSFTGDDDLWLFIDRQLVIDLGGLHPALSDTVDLDTLGLTAGQIYPLDLFHAERRHDQSNFRLDTSIDCFMAPID